MHSLSSVIRYPRYWLGVWALNDQNLLTDNEAIGFLKSVEFALAHRLVRAAYRVLVSLGEEEVRKVFKDEWDIDTDLDALAEETLQELARQGLTLSLKQPDNTLEGLI